MAAVTLKFSGTLSPSDPKDNPVVIVGQPRHLAKISYDDVSCKLQPRVTAETFSEAVSSLHPTPTDSCPLWLNNATIAALPVKCSRHNTPSRAHALAKLVKSCLAGGEEYVVIVCERRDVFASASAVARILPLYTAKSTASSTTRVVTIEFLLVDDGEMLSAEDIDCLDALAYGVRLAAKIVDIPCADMHTDAFLEEVRDVGKKLNIEPVIIQGEDLKEKGLGGIYGVGKAAVHLPALAVLSHRPEKAEKNIAWVGKGIVYDTGGLCIKTKVGMCGMKRDCGGAAGMLGAFYLAAKMVGMCGMKRDCGGAAGMLGAFYLAAKMGFRENLHAVFCLAENAVGPLSYKPDDILTLYSGKTVEINNTDAEGRLVLGDGVSYAQKDLKADVVVDMATLTGAQGIATGKYHASILTNNEDWELACVKAGQNSGDLVHPVPYSPELHYPEFSSAVADMKNSVATWYNLSEELYQMPYSPELHYPEFSSAVADMKNSVADRSNAQVSCAGLFIGSHLGFDYPGVWLHIDMASPAHVGDRATGYGPALLNTLFGQKSSSKLLQSIAPPISVWEQMEIEETEESTKKMKV